MYMGCVEGLWRGVEHSQYSGTVQEQKTGVEPLQSGTGVRDEKTVMRGPEEPLDSSS